MPTTDETLIGATEAAGDLGVSKDTLIRMIARGDITPVGKLPGDNGAYIFHRADVEDLVAAKEKAEALRAIPVAHTCHVNGDACDACNDARYAKSLRDDAAALSASDFTQQIAQKGA